MTEWAPSCSSPSSSLRPPHSLSCARSSFSLALFPVLLLLLRSEAQKPSRRIWLAVPLLALWANLHGGVLVGFGVVAAYLRAPPQLRQSPISTSVLFPACTGALFATLRPPRDIPLLRRACSAAASFGALTAVGAASLHVTLDRSLHRRRGSRCSPRLVRSRPLAWELVLLFALGVMSVEATRNGIWFLMFAATPDHACEAAANRCSRPLLSRRLALVCACVPALMLGGWPREAAG